MHDLKRDGRRTEALPGGGRELAVWAFGLLCGVGIAAADEALLLPFSLALALAGGLPLAGLALRQLLRPRRRVVVWEESYGRRIGGPLAGRPHER